MNWIIGLSVSLIVGHVVTASTLVFLRRYIEGRKDADKLLSPKQRRNFFLGIDFYPPEDSSVRQVPPWITGPAERLFFTFIVAFGISGASISMIGWITLKMLASREHRKERAKKENIPSALPFEFVGLLGNLLSMFFALIGGLITQ